MMPTIQSDTAAALRAGCMPERPVNEAEQHGRSEAHDSASTCVHQLKTRQSALPGPRKLSASERSLRATSSAATSFKRPSEEPDSASSFPSTHSQTLGAASLTPSPRSRSLSPHRPESGHGVRAETQAQAPISQPSASAEAAAQPTDITERHSIRSGAASAHAPVLPQGPSVTEQLAQHALRAARAHATAPRRHSSSSGVLKCSCPAALRPPAAPTPEAAAPTKSSPFLPAGSRLRPSGSVPAALGSTSSDHQLPHDNEHDTRGHRGDDSANAAPGLRAAMDRGHCELPSRVISHGSGSRGRVKPARVRRNTQACYLHVPHFGVLLNPCADNLRILWRSHSTSNQHVSSLLRRVGNRGVLLPFLH
jgi:hypothetical protein